MKQNEGYLDLSQPETAAAMQSYLLGDWDTAHKSFEKLSAKDPGNHYFSYILGEIHNAMGHLDEAVRHYRNAVQKKPDFGVAYYKMGVSLYRLGRLEESLSSFSTLLAAKGQSHAMASYFFGLINQFLGNDEEAERGFAILRKESRESLIANYYLAQLKIKHHRYAEALELLDELLAATPNLAEVQYQKGVVFMGMHKNMDAIKSFRRTLELNPGDKRARANLDLLTDVPEP
jgi:tetratricopeptide (TPR) repeat protein